MCLTIGSVQLRCRIVADYMVINASVLLPYYAGERLVYSNDAYTGILLEHSLNQID